MDKFIMNSAKPVASEKKVVMILMLCGLFVVSQVYFLIPLVGLLQKYFTISNNKALWIISAFNFAYAGGFLLLGPLSDRFGRKRLMLGGLLSLSIITFIIGFVHNFEVLLILRILQGLIASTFAPTAMAYVGELSSENIRVIGLSLLIMAFALSSIFGQVLASIISEKLNWHWVFWIFAVIYIVAIFFIASQLTNTQNIKIKSSIIHIYKNMVLHFGNITLIPLYFTSFIILMSFVAIYSVLKHYLMQKFGLAPQNIVYIRMAGIPSMCLSPFAGYFARRFGGSSIVFIGLTVLILGLLCESLSSSLTYFTLSSALFDAGIAITTPSIVIMINKVAQHAKGSAMSLYTFFLFSGAGIGPLVNTELYKLGFSGICYTFIMLFIVCIILLFFVAKKIKKFA